MNLIIKIFSKIIIVIFGYSILTPLSLLIPKKKNLVVFIGREYDLFIDNIKYLYIFFYNHDNKFEFYFFTSNINEYRALQSHGLPVIFDPFTLNSLKRFKSFFKNLYLLLRTRIIIVDSGFWGLKLRYYLFFNCFKLQLWHGVPLKKNWPAGTWNKAKKKGAGTSSKIRYRSIHF